MRITKMHGIGNDYVYVDCFEQPSPSDPPDLARRISDRHTGVGGDGLVLIEPSELADARMRMFNADGSESEMCGNAIRCVAKYLFDHDIAREEQLQIETGAGVLAVDLEIAGGQARRARVAMGKPELAPAQIPVAWPDASATQLVDVPLEMPAGYTRPGYDPNWPAVCGWDGRMTCVSMGNPHAVLYCDDVEAVPLEMVGPVLEQLELFPRRMNIHFVQARTPIEVTMRTWERGSGITLACGTGAAAVCVAGVLRGRGDREVLAHLPGGDLALHWAEDGAVYMTGPAVEVFSGEWPE